MQLLALSLNYKSAPLALREQVAFSEEQIVCALADLRRAVPALTESAVISTCNRTEIYGCAEQPADAFGAITDWLAKGSSLLRSELHAHARLLGDESAARHVFRVASGLDSMVLGEPQILGQIKNAARNAQLAGTLGPLLHQLFQRAFAAAKDVRTQTHIGKGVVSHAAAAVELARGLFGELRHARVLCIGAGTMIDSVAPYFAAQNPGELAIANRTRERGERIARRFGSRILGLGELDANLQRFDIVLSCTGSMQPLVTAAMVRRAQLARAGKPLLIVDFGVPRDIEPQAATIAGVSLYTIDELGELVASRVAVRGEAVADAQAIVDMHVKCLMDWVAMRPCVPLLRRLNEQAERLRNAEIERARRFIAQGRPLEHALTDLATSLSNKLLHAPRTLLRASSAPEQAQRFLDHWVGALERGVRL